MGEISERLFFQQILSYLKSKTINSEIIMNGHQKYSANRPYLTSEKSIFKTCNY